MNLSRNSYGPIVLGAALFALGLAAWRMFVQPRMPEQLSGGQRVVPVYIERSDALTPLWRYGAPHEGGLLIAGDSRVSGAFLVDELARQGHSDAMVLMGPIGQLCDSLAVARTLPMRRLVLGLSPLSVYAPPTSESEFRRLRELRRSATSRFDVYAGREFAALRHDVVRPLELWHWRTGWFERSTAGDDQPYYRTLLAPDTYEARAARLVELEADLRRLLDDGWQVACVRLPAGRVLQEIEEAALPAQRLTALCERLGVPYLDYWTADFATTDGSHLTAGAARRFSAQFAADLALRAPRVAARGR
ncbi:MAG: hypothetical protein R3F49_16585 [Planctomycetota bacterium]